MHKFTAFRLTENVVNSDYKSVERYLTDIMMWVILRTHWQQSRFAMTNEIYDDKSDNTKTQEQISHRAIYETELQNVHKIGQIFATRQHALILPLVMMKRPLWADISADKNEDNFQDERWGWVKECKTGFPPMRKSGKCSAKPSGIASVLLHYDDSDDGGWVV